MAVLDSLSVQVTGDSDSFERAINNAEGALSGLNPDVVETAAALQVLQGRADEAGDEIGAMAPKATTASAGLTGLGISATGTSAAFSGLTAVTVASLLPALVTLSTVLIPIVGALGGFVAVAGAIVGLGFAGAMGAIATNTQQLKTSAMAVADTFRDVFAPVINAATVTISNLLNQLEAIAPELALTNSEAMGLANLFTDLGSALIDLLPSLVDLGVSLAQEFLPPFVDFVEDVGPQLPGIIRGFVGVFRDLLPLIQRFGSWLATNAPALNQFGLTVLSVLVPAFSQFGDVLMRGVRAVNNLDQSLSRLVTAGTILLPVLTGIATLLGGPVALAVAGLVAGVVALNQAFKTNFLGIRGDVERFSNLVKSVLPAAREAFEAFVSGANIPAIKDAVDGLATALDTQLSATITALEPVFSDFKTLLQDNKEEFQIIGSAVGFLVGGLIRLTTTLISVLAPGFRNVIIPIFRGFIDVIDFGLTKLAEFIELAGAIQAGNLDEAISAGNQLFGGGENPELSIDLPNTGGTESQIEQQIEVVVEGDTGVVEDVAARETDRKLLEQSDRITQNTGTGP